MNESKNPFESLSDYPLLHILSYLTRNDLMKLSLMDTNFNRLITESKETKSKIPLVLNFQVPFVLSDVTEIAHTRHFVALKIQNVNGNIRSEFTPLMELLSRSVEHLEFAESKMYENSFRSILQMFLPVLKTCNVEGLGIFNATISTENDDSSNHPLQSLTVRNAAIVKFFSGCKNLTSFFCERKGHTDRLYEFLSSQKNLSKLVVHIGNVDLNRIRNFNLKILSLSKWQKDDISRFLGNAPNLTTLSITINSQREMIRTISAICNVPNLESLSLALTCKVPKIPFERLENHTVKKLNVTDGRGEATGWLMKIFRGVESIKFVLRPKVNGPTAIECIRRVDLADVSNVTNEMIDKIVFEPEQEPIHLTFSPVQAPVDVGSFESSVMKFAKKFSAKIGSLTIGHNHWRNYKDLSLSNLFCEDLVKSLPNLIKLELFNVIDRGAFSRFLESHETNLQNVQLISREPHDTSDEPKVKESRK